ncbi:MAG TPA: exodeoxyribonuclease V subunit beta, partial [Ectothiorhodospiraceae bacterium]|nr:exodeoxyribonuclease V subunit beta [Ectothiorhodospiraceae bacterium]
MSITNFRAVDNPLQRGINLIEASAGTGKTYTIAMLVLRFIVEREIPIEQQLVVTFTKAATEELKVRVRARLRDALNIVAYPEGEHDPNLVEWIARLDIPQETIIQRLRTAIVDLDRASIFTIHGLCQRLLSEFPLDGRQQFEQELMADTSSIMQSIMDDFWRREFYRRPKEEVAPLRWRY